MMKKRLESLFIKDKDQSVPTPSIPQLKEQIDILNRLLISKEDDLKNNESQYFLMAELWKEKEKKHKQNQMEKDRELGILEREIAERENELLQSERAQTESIKEISILRNKIDWFEEKLKSKEELFRLACHRETQCKLELKSTQERLKEKTKENELIEQKLTEMGKKWAEMSAELEKVRASELTKTFLESSLLPDGMKGNGFENSCNQYKAEIEELNKNLEEERTVKDDLIVLVVKVSQLVFSSNIGEFLGSTQLKVKDGLKHRLLETEKKLSEGDQRDNFIDKLKVFEDMLRAKEIIISQYQEKFINIQQDLLSKEEEGASLNRQLKALQERLEVCDNKHQQKKIEDLSIYLNKLSEEIEEKEMDLQLVSSKVQAAESELERKNTKLTLLSTKLMESKIKLHSKERQIKELKNKDDMLSAEIGQNDSLLTTYSEILRSKEETLKSKEELAYHFFDLIKQSDEQIRVKDDQVTQLYSTLHPNLT